MSDPFLTIITVNLNNAGGLSKTMMSVMSQTFDNTEYIVIDGGSTDGSVDLIKNNKQKIQHWVSEKDKGVYHAMNKGVLKASGEYILFLNSGDYFASKDILMHACQEMKTDDDIVYGDMFLEKDNTVYYEKRYPDKLTFKYFFHGLESLPHPSTFIKRSLFEQIGFYSENFKIVSDWEFSLKAIFLHQVRYRRIPYSISVFNMDGVSSNIVNESLVIEEKDIVYNRYFAGFIDDYKEMNLTPVVSFEIISIKKAVAHSLRRRWKNIRNLFR
ncbi:glycosyltransferase family 2 protein [Flavitalea antarctica]